MRVAGAQLNLVVGDLGGNEERIAAAMDWAAAEEADVLLLPELAVTGYPPEDLVLKPAFIADNLAVVERLAARAGRTRTVVGFIDRVPDPPDRSDAVERRLANAVAVLGDGRLLGVYHKVLLPNYGVFDEERYFAVGATPAATWRFGGETAGISICEDIWIPGGPPARQAEAGARVLLNVSASPFHAGKAREREAMLAARAVETGATVVALNLVGGQDELVFDGASVVIAADGAVLHRSPQFVEDRFVVDVPAAPPAGRVADLPGPEEEVYTALVTGLGDYVRKNGFSAVVVGLSGGIDSALTATVAVDALGADRVWGVTMPSRFSSEGSVADSAELAANLGIRFDVVPIEEVFAAYLATLSPLFAGTEPDVAEENLQARIRGALLMALSNKFGALVVTTGNKSELAVGYATLYGDMAGGFSVLKDVFKTVVYRLARWRNGRRPDIPEAILAKPPSAELRPGQLDADSLPPYDILDGILRRYVEGDESVDDIVAAGFGPDVVRRVATLVDRAEYKRRQAAPGVKITTKAFGRDRRLPVTNRYAP